MSNFQSFSEKVHVAQSYFKIIIKQQTIIQYKNLYLVCILISRLQTSKFNKKLCCQSKLILNCCLLLIRSIKVDVSIVGMTVSHSCQHALSFVGFFSSSFDIGNVSNKLVSGHYIIHLKMKVKITALVSNLKHTA